jgi:HEXXH motif-containing protein
MIQSFELAAEDLLALAHRPADASILEILRSSQASKHMLLMRIIRSRNAHPAWDAGLSVFAQEQAAQAAARIILDPWTGVWAARCVRLLNRTGDLPPTEMFHFNALAAAGAIGAGLDADLTLPVRDGVVYIPTMGAFRVKDDHGAHELRIRRGESGVIPDDRTVETPTWLGCRRLTAQIGHGAVEAVLDDLSPYRNSFRLPPTDRVSAGAFHAWQRLWTQAWSLLARCAPARAAQLPPCVNTAVPLAREAGRAGFSATSREAFGALALSYPDNAVSLAVTLVHEGQHAKLCALLDIIDLYRCSPARYFAPWRDDPRPIGGLLQGTYAFLGIAETWWRLSAEPGLEHSALEQFALVREQVAVAMTTLEIGRAHV